MPAIGNGSIDEQRQTERCVHDAAGDEADLNGKQTDSSCNAGVQDKGNGEHRVQYQRQAKDHRLANAADAGQQRKLCNGTVIFTLGEHQDGKDQAQGQASAAHNNKHRPEATGQRIGRSQASLHGSNVFGQTGSGDGTADGLHHQTAMDAQEPEQLETTAMMTTPAVLCTAADSGACTTA